MVVSRTIHVMLLSPAGWRTFTSRPIPPPGASAVMLALTCDSCDAVDAMNDAAAERRRHRRQPGAGPRLLSNRALADPDGHVFEAVFVDMSAMSTE